MMYVWFLIFSALLGALVATYVGYRFRCLESGEQYVYELCGLAAGIIVMLLIILGFDWTSLDTDKPSVSLAIFVSLMSIMLLYCYAVMFCAVWGEELNYPASVRKARRQKRSRKIEAVVTAEDVRRALRRAEQQEYEEELSRMVDLADGIEWIDLDADSSLIPVKTKRTKSALQPRPQTTTRPRKTSQPIARPAAVGTMKALVKHLRKDDLRLVFEAFRREPALFWILKNTELFAKLEIIGSGNQKHVRIKGAVYPRKKVV